MNVFRQVGDTPIQLNQGLDRRERNFRRYLPSADASSINSRRQSRRGCERDDRWQHLVDPLRGIGANMQDVPPELKQTIGPISRDDVDVGDEDDPRDKHV